MTSKTPNLFYQILARLFQTFIFHSHSNELWNVSCEIDIHHQNKKKKNWIEDMNTKIRQNNFFPGKNQRVKKGRKSAENRWPWTMGTIDHTRAPQRKEGKERMRTRMGRDGKRKAGVVLGRERLRVWEIGGNEVGKVTGLAGERTLD